MSNYMHDEDEPREPGVILEPVRFGMVPHWIMEHPQITGNTLRVYLNLRKRAGVKSLSWPSKKTIATDLCLSVPTVETSLGLLSRIGAVEITARYGSDGRQTSNLYRVNWDKPEGNNVVPIMEKTEAPIQKMEEGPHPKNISTNLYKEEPIQIEDIQVLKRIDHPSLQKNNSLDPFNEFWSAYPRRAAKGAARIAWLKAIKRAPAHVIIQGAWAYSDDPNRDPAFTKHPSTWLNSDCWEDDPLPNATPMTAREIMFKKSDALIMELQEKEQSFGVGASPWKALEQ